MTGDAYVFATGAVEHLRSALLDHRPNEAAAVLLAGRASHAGRRKILIRENVLVPPGAYAAQEPLYLSIRPEFLAPLIKRARNEGWSIVFVHTHPFGATPRFSPVDDEGERVLMPAVFNRAPERPHGNLVLGPVGFDARVWLAPNEEPQVVESLVESGRDVRVHWRGEAVKHHEDTSAVFERSVRALGAEGQVTLRKMVVGIIGLGGIGSLVAEQLAHLGVGRLILLDDDVIEETNLNRVVGANRRSVGRPKVDVAAEYVRRIRDEVGVEAIRGNVLVGSDSAQLLLADFLFCCTDSHGSRAVLNQIAYQYMIPTIDCGVRIQVRTGIVETISGRTQMLAPGLPCLVCHNLLDSEEVRRDFLTDDGRRRDPYIVGAREPQPSVISLNGTVASLSVTMMLAAVTGLPSVARHQVFMADRGVVRAVESSADPRCVVCSLGGAFGRGDLWPIPGRPR